MGLEKHPVLVSVLVSKKLSGLGLEACGLDYNTDTQYTVRIIFFNIQNPVKLLGPLYYQTSDIDSVKDELLIFIFAVKLEITQFFLEVLK